MQVCPAEVQRSSVKDKKCKCNSKNDRATSAIVRQREEHITQIQQIQQSVEQFVRQKQQQSKEMQEAIKFLSEKCKKYKERCLGLNQNIKLSSNTIKDLTKRISSLEYDLTIQKQQKNKLSKQNEESRRLIIEYKQMMHLLEKENGVLSKKLSNLNDQNANLRETILSLKQFESNSKDYSVYDESQYTQQIQYLKENLKIQLLRSTNELFKDVKVEKLPSHKDEFTKQSPSQDQTIEQQQLRSLASLAKKGQSLIECVDPNIWKSSYCREIYGFIKRIVQDNKQLSIKMINNKQQFSKTTHELRFKLEQLSQEIQQRNVSKVHFGVQVVDFSTIKINQIINNNSFLKIKLIEAHNIIQILSFFAAQMIKIWSYLQAKLNFYRINQSLTYNNNNFKKKSINRFKVVAQVVLFIQISKKLKNKRNISTSIVEQQHLDSSINNFQVKPLIKQFFTCLATKSRKNPSIQHLFTQKGKTNCKKKFLCIMTQQLMGISSTNAFELRLLQKYFQRK